MNRIKFSRGVEKTSSTTVLEDEASGRNFSSDDFRAAFSKHPAGVAVITAQSAEGPIGITATSVISVSANPATLVFSLSEFSSTAPALAQAETIIVHLLNSDQVSLAKTFSTSGIDRFSANTDWYSLTTGEPVLRAVKTWLRGRIVNKMKIGESNVIALEILDGTINTSDDSEVSPLVYHNRSWHKIDHESCVARNEPR